MRHPDAMETAGRFTLFLPSSAALSRDEVKGDIYTLKLCESPEVERRAHVGQLIRYRGQDAQDVDEEGSDAHTSATPTAASREVFEKLSEVDL